MPNPLDSSILYSQASTTRQGDTPDRIPDKSVIFDPKFGISVLSHCGGGSNQYTATTGAGRTVDLEPNRVYTVIATPADLANRFLAEVSDRLVNDTYLNTARSLLHRCEG